MKNTFEKVIKDNNLYLLVSSLDASGNILLNYRLAKDENSYNVIKNEILTTLSTQLNEYKSQQDNATKIILSLEEQLEALKTI